MRTDNQAKRGCYETGLDKLLESAFQNDTVELMNGRISREWIRKQIGCSQNWPNQNKHAKTVIAEYEKKLREKGIEIHRQPTGGVKSKDVKLLMQRVSRLEQRNAQLLEENSQYRYKLLELGWLESDDEQAAQGRLPW
tara:strand:- start:52 stop:465 length:414 start_codon:yes stop_codon:yes gene_type:complete